MLAESSGFSAGPRRLHFETSRELGIRSYGGVCRQTPLEVCREPISGAGSEIARYRFLWPL